MWESLILYLIMLIVTIFSIKKKKNILEKIGFKKTMIPDEFWYSFLTFTALIVTAIIISIVFISLGFSKDASKVSEVIQSIPLWQVLIVLLVGSIVEEIFFRGFLQRKTNLLTASFVFAYFHIIYGSITEITGAFFLGLILGYVYQKRNNLFAPTLAHIFYNLLTVTIIYTM